MRLTLPVSTAVLVTLLSPSASAHVNWFVEPGAATLPNYGMTDPVFLVWSALTMHMAAPSSCRHAATAVWGNQSLFRKKV